MSRALVLASLLWPLVLGLAAWQRAHETAPVWSTVVYAACSHICHQKPERSFHLAAVAWPVCARCSGLYLAAPIGALVALLPAARRVPRRRSLAVLAVASLPTAITLGLEWAAMAEPSNLARAIAALPAGAMIAFILIRTAAGPAETIE